MADCTFFEPYTVTVMRMFLGLVLFVLLGITSLPLLSYCALVLDKAFQHTLYERCAFQLTQIGARLGSLFGLLLFVVVMMYKKELDSTAPVYQSIMWFVLSWYYLGLAGQLIVSFSWAKLVKTPILHGLSVALSAIFFGIFIVLILFLVEYDLSQELSPIGHLEDVFTAFGVILKNSIVQYIVIFTVGAHFIESIAAGALGFFWLVWRRNKDNFGRDYYAFAMKYCSKWSAYGSWASLILIAGLILWYRADQISCSFFGGCICWVLSSILWTIISLSKKPVCYKIAGMFAILLFIYGGLLFESTFLP